MGHRTTLASMLVIACLLFAGCLDDGDGNGANRDFRQDMRDLVQAIADHARHSNPEFIVIPQNGHELLTLDGEPDGPLARDYVSAIDGVGREDLFYGYDGDNVPTPAAEREYMLGFMDRFEESGVQVLVTDYCWGATNVDDSFSQSAQRGYVSFAADHRELDDIPAYPSEPYNVHDGNVFSLAEARNFLYLIGPGGFESMDDFIDALRGTNHDLLIIDLFWQDEQLWRDEVDELKVKANGGSRLVVAYMSIGEAEDYRYYWRSSWEDEPPPWLAGENPHWPGNYKVRYWHPGWQDIIYRELNSYLERILDAGFDGVYLDIIDAFEYFEG